METARNTSEGVLMVLLKEPFLTHTITSLADALNVTRQGLWKTIKKLDNEKIINLEPIGKGKTSTTIIKLNWKNQVVEKTLSLQLTKEALKHERWEFNFKELEPNVSFLLLFGSILNNPKEAKDIDILAVVKNKSSFKVIEEAVSKVQKTQIKKIHLVDLTETEFSNELKSGNKAYLDAMKKGVVLFGIEDYVQFVKSLQNGKY